MVKYPGSKTLLMVNHEYSVEEAERVVREGVVDFVAFGRPFIYNRVCFLIHVLFFSEGEVDHVNVVQDLISRVKNGIPLAGNDRGGRVNYGPYETVDEFYNDWPRAVV